MTRESPNAEAARLRVAAAGCTLAALLAATPAAAEITSRSDSGFELQSTRTVGADPRRSYAVAVRDIGRWWNPEHTYSGVSRKLRLEPRPGGCLCERLANRGGVLHMQVSYVAPGESLRMLGGLGPLQELAASGALTWTFRKTEAGGTQLSWTYRVTGLQPAAAAKLAPVVDQVLTAQLERLARFIESGVP